VGGGRGLSGAPAPSVGRPGQEQQRKTGCETVRVACRRGVRLKKTRKDDAKEKTYRGQGEKVGGGKREPEESPRGGNGNLIKNKRIIIKKRERRPRPSHKAL